jgi:hypothetical protein
MVKKHLKKYAMVKSKFDYLRYTTKLFFLIIFIISCQSEEKVKELQTVKN